MIINLIESGIKNYMIKIKKVFIKSNNIKNKDGIKMMVKIKRYIKMLDF